MTTFGRKGLQPGEVPPAVPTGQSPGWRSAAGAADGAGGAVSPQLAAFLAAERQRGGADGAPAASSIPADTRHRTGAAAAPGHGQGRRSLLVAYVLWWFAGAFGAHRFYLGATQSAIAMLGLLVAAIGMIFLLPVAGFALLIGWACWYLADAILIIGLARREPAPDPAAVFA